MVVMVVTAMVIIHTDHGGIQLMVVVMMITSSSHLKYSDDGI